MTTPSNIELFQAGLQPSDVVSPLDAAAILEAAESGENIDTSSVNTSGSPAAGSEDTGIAAAPAAATPPPPPAAPAPAPVAAAPAPGADPVVLAKDGVHTIPYQTFKDTREALAAAQAQIATMRAAADQAAAAGATPAQVAKTEAQIAQAQAALDQGLDPALFGDWSPEAMAEGISKAITLGNKAMADQVAALSQAVQGIVGATEKTAIDKHYEAIYKAHPDADSIYESKELKDWIGSKPAYLQPRLNEMFEKGTTQEIVAFLNDYRTETGKTAAPAAAPAAQADPNAVRKAATAAIAAARETTAVPASVSDIAGASPGPGSVFEVLDAMAESNPAGLSEALQALSPSQREDYLNHRG